ncbi:MAG: TerB family tellurite resistance protein [Cytophagales bacterium]|nr:TerB family tellurite resistance protein [Cytophagales bacterium]
MSIQSQLSALIALANIDGDFDGEEKTQIYMLGKANGMSKEEVDNLIDNPVPLPPVSTMTPDEKFDYLYNIVQLMKIDSQVYLSEIKYCEDLAEKLGFKRKVISTLASRVYSDPSITANIASLKKAVKKYEA